MTGSPRPNAASNSPASRSAWAWTGYPGAGSHGLIVTGTACGFVMSMTVTSGSAAVAARRPWSAGPARASVSHGVRAELSPARTVAASRAAVTLVVTMSEY